jgi:prepilin peptidase CpaA
MSLLPLAGVILWMAVLAVLAAAAVIDARRRIIPNESVVLIVAGGVALSALSRPDSILPSLLLGLIVLLTLLVVAHFNVLGAGDAKLIAASTLLVPPEHIVLLIMAIALAGGLLSGVYLAAFHSLKHAHAAKRHGARSGLHHPAGSFAQFRRAGHARMRSGYSVPYALAVLGGVVFYLTSELYQCSSGISCSL